MAIFNSFLYVYQWLCSWMQPTSARTALLGSIEWELFTWRQRNRSGRLVAKGRENAGASKVVISTSRTAEIYHVKGFLDVSTWLVAMYLHSTYCILVGGDWNHGIL